MKRYYYLALLGVVLVVAGLVLLMPVLAQEGGEGTTVPERPEVLTGYYDLWVNSPHADVTAEAFNHWNEDEELVVPTSCARCHSTPGYLDYLGEDGTLAGSVENDAPLGTTITCDACHNDTTTSLTAVTFPSGVEVTGLNDASRCMVCHQGRSSGGTVDERIADAGVTDMNVVSEDLGFINIHYYAAAASLYGSEAMGGYQFAGNTYQMRFEHTEGFNTCIDCHDPHTLEIQIDTCGDCHEDVDSEDDLHEIRMNGSLIDYDGDGDIEEGIAEEIYTLQDMTYEAIKRYAAEVIGTPIIYDSHAYPYFFVDTNADGEPGEDEANYGNRYNAFSGLLLQATYNYQVTQKDPGQFAHNAKYHIELLYDTIAMLNAEIGDPVDLSLAHRDDPGHFNSTGEPFRHWDEDEEVSASCTRCHTAEGLPFYLENGVTIAGEPSNSIACSTCHDNIGEFTLYASNEVEFPSGAVLSFGEEEPANLCINCHQGRESTPTVNVRINNAGVGDDEASDALSFRNIHYFPAGATLFGNEAQGAYQYEGKEYSGQNVHTRRYDTCVDCHNEHSLEIRFDDCIDCHEELEDPGADVTMIRLDEDYDPVDYDGDGDVAEPVLDEITTLHDALYVEIQAYAAETLGTPIGYNSHAYPYFFADVNGDGAIDDEEAIRDNAYGVWTPRLVRAAFNYQYGAKDPGKFAHNPDYVLQFLYDSLEDIGGMEAVANFNRAPVRAMDE